MTSPPTTGHKIFGGRYAVEAPLGSGATATVYLCSDRTTMQPVAVKVLHMDLAESVGAERFLREIRLTAGLDHPSILPVIDSGADGSILWCVLPYMEGGTLRDLLREKKQLAIPEAIEIGKTIAEALAYAHDRGLIHRDIKPENILFSKGKAFLGDFGIARALYATASDLTTTTTGVIRGTPAYMSPEQASGERNYDGRSDIYSLGAVVYEMISGMPPFVGPTAQSVMAQRFSHTPREMRVYRASVPPGLEAVVSKAMMTAPADRYSSSSEFGEALTGAASAPSNLVRRRWTVAAAIVAVATVGLLVDRGLRPREVNTAYADTTQLAVLPFEKEGDTRALGAIDAMLYSAFSAWRGITVLEPYRVRDALLKVQTPSGVVDHRAVALSLNAARFVRGSVAALPAGRGWIVQAWLHQAGIDTAIQRASATIRPSDLVAVDRVYQLIAKTLLLRVGAVDTSEAEVTATNDLPAMQDFAAGIDALDEWDFARSDSAFQRALDRDPRYARAALWQAHVRLWQRLDSPAWAPLAERASRDSARLPSRERALARAITALGAKDFDLACRLYRQLTQKSTSDFTAWFGLAQCQDRDYRVVRTATGWRYVASFEGAMRAYQRAFDVLALSHRSMNGSAFQPLRELLAMRPSQLRSAQAPANDTVTLLGRLDLDGDTLVMRPYPAAKVFAADPGAVPAHLREAIRVQQQRFGAIAKRWSTALPRSPGAKEAVAVGLELAGDPAALDTLRRARALAVDSLAQLRLVTAELTLRLKQLRAGQESQATAVRRLADSILRSNRGAPREFAPYLAVAATVVGDCGAVDRFLGDRPVSRNPGVDPSIVGRADAVTTRLAMGCDVAPGEIVDVSNRIYATAGARPEWATSLVGSAVRLAAARGLPFPVGQGYTARDPLLRAQQAAGTGAYTDARTLLANLERSRAITGYDDVRPEALYAEARLALKMGDTTTAARIMDAFLARAAVLTPGMLSVPATSASLIKVMKLRGQLGHARGEPAESGWILTTRPLQ